MVGEIELLRGRELDSLGTGSQAVTPRGPVDVCGGEGRPLTAVKAGANGSPSFSFSMNGAVLMAGMCSTADIVPGVGHNAGMLQVGAARRFASKLSAGSRDAASNGG